MTELKFANDLKVNCLLKNAIKRTVNSNRIKSTVQVLLLLCVLFCNDINFVQADDNVRLCDSKDMNIAKIQGDFNYSPLTKPKDKKYKSDNEVTVVGVISATVIESVGFNRSGFFMQMEVRSKQLNVDFTYASSGIFVQVAELGLFNAGDKVCVTGVAFENYGMTSLIASDIYVLANKVYIRAANINIALRDRNLRDTLERYEGMLVNINRFVNLLVTKPLHFNKRYQRVQLLLSYEQLNLHPHSNNYPNSILAQNLGHKNKYNRLYIESIDTETTKQRAKLGIFESIHVADKVTNLIGIIDFRFGQFRLLLLNPVTEKNIIHAHEEEELKPKQAGNIRIATLNVNNYFVSHFSGDVNPVGKVRGIKKPALQQKKEAILAAIISRLNADFIGLMEIENNGFADGSAIQRLKRLVNGKIKNIDDHYQVVEPKLDGLYQNKFLDTGLISVGALYRPNRLTLEKAFVLELPKQYLREACFSKAGSSLIGKNPKIWINKRLKRKVDKIKHRRTLMAILTDNSMNNGTRRKDKSKRFLIAVNHLKSKGSACRLDNLENQHLTSNKRVVNQGRCNSYRIMAATYLKQQMFKLSQQYRTKGVILGDLNSYSKEQPLQILTNLKPDSKYAYINPFSKQRNNNWTYSFKDLGSLDYILIEQLLYKSLIQQQVWQIKQLPIAILGSKALLPTDTNCDRCEVINNISLFLDHYPIVIDLK